MVEETLHAICADIRRIARAAGAISDDEKISLRQVGFWVNGYRQKSIQFVSDMGKEWSILTQIQQVYRCKILKRVDKAECSYKWGEKVLKLVDAPRFLDLPDHRAVLFLGLINGEDNFTYAEPSAIADKLNTQFGSNFSYWYTIPSKAGMNYYVVPCERHGGKDLRAIMLRGVAHNPEEWDDCIKPDLDMDCTPMYPLISGTLVDIKTQILTRELNLSLQTATDLLNNAKADV